MCISNMLIADLRAVNQEPQYSKLISTLKTLTQSWDPNDVMPPHIDIISNFFPANIMRKPTVKPQTKNGMGPKGVRTGTQNRGLPTSKNLNSSVRK